ncbi:BMA-MTM-9, isoform c [Aphelenchoides fujianensis]|nr:BMA-MTM-9, isoform c [Aphelenchoides fujianensis]
MELIDAIEKTRVDQVELFRGPRPRQVGSLVLTGHHLIFAPAESERNTSEFWLLHRAVDRVLVEATSNAVEAPALLHLKCKNFLICSFNVPNQNDCNAVARSIERLSNLNNIELEYPFYHPKSFEFLDDGWTAFDIDHTFAALSLAAGDRWRISAINKNFEVCPSYPERVIVPRTVRDDHLRISATYRDSSRFPVLAYFHVASQSSIMRCGQPLVSPTSRRCKEDESVLNALITPNTKGVIFDTRTEAVAVSARAKGGGKEQRYHYSQWRYVHGNLPRMRDYKESLTKLIEACVDAHDSDKWLSKLAASLWLQYVADGLTAAASIAQWIHCSEQELPVVVHGGEGLDTTLLVTSLAQILLDPDARTVRGFQAIVEREWITAGHPFAVRCAHGAFAQGMITGVHESPIFLSFLDCVWQLQRQYPSSFEFNQEFLILLAEHAYASEFGSFLGNNEAEKARHGVKERTASLWSYVNHPKVLVAYINPVYKPYDSTLFPSVAAQSIVLWERFYLRWQRNWAKFDEIFDTMTAWKTRANELRAKLLARSTPNACPPPLPPRNPPTTTPNSNVVVSNGKDGDLIDLEAKVAAM